MSTPIIEVEKISKMYRLGVVGTTTLREDLHRLGLWFKRSPAPSSSSDFWALKDVSFSVHAGDVLGIIGRNGAGKSTLLKILSRITEPSGGRAVIGGRVASLLEVGTGFHPDLTGRENVFLNGTILGMKRAEIARQFDEIVSFAGVRSFIDTPVKHYSSGMRVRLAFAVAAHLSAEILIIDEVLAVGDAEFQKQCLQKMNEVAGAGRTVIFVSHNLAALRTLCTHGVVLEGGRVVCSGTAEDALTHYQAQSHQAAGQEWIRPSLLPAPSFALRSARVALTGKQPRHTLAVDLVIACSEATKPGMVAIDIRDHLGTPILQVMPGSDPFVRGVPGTHFVSLTTELPPLVPGDYLVDVWIGSHHTATVDYIQEALRFSVLDSPTPGRTFPHSSDHGPIALPSACRYDHREIAEGGTSS